jgi:glycosyltransferase involved in cell wall biosynthesis
MIRIGVNALYLIPGGVGGTEIYLRNLLRALATIDSENQYIVFTNRETGADLVPNRPNFVRAPQPVRASFRPARIVWEQLALPFAARNDRLNVLFNPGFTAPLLCGCPMVTVFHDLQHKRYPQYFRWFDLPFWNFFVWASALRSRGAISVSVATHDDLQRFYGRPSEVIHHGVEREFIEIAHCREPQDYLLCVSTTHPHKNLQRLLRVHAQLKNAPKLVLTGVRGFAAKEIESLADESVEIKGWVPREQLIELYRGALGFIYPSTFEGFGMPVLEAMAAGVPVACSDIPPLREIARSTVHFFDPSSDREIRDALLLLVSGKISTDAAQRRAAQFTWEKTARATLDYLNKCSS